MQAGGRAARFGALLRPPLWDPAGPIGPSPHARGCGGPILLPLDVRWTDATPAARRREDVFEQAGDGHRTDSARYGGDCGGALGSFVERDVADQPRLAIRTGGAVDADIDDDGTGTDPIAANHLRPADRHDQPVGAAAQAPQIARARMRDRHRAVRPEPELRQRATEQLRAPADHRAAPRA